MPDPLLSISRAALDGDALATRSLLQNWLTERPTWPTVPRPRTDDARLLAVAASLAELLAERAGAKPPDWTVVVAPLEEPVYLLRSATTCRDCASCAGATDRRRCASVGSSRRQTI